MKLKVLIKNRIKTYTLVGYDNSQLDGLTKSDNL